MQFPTSYTRFEERGNFYDRSDIFKVFVEILRSKQGQMFKKRLKVVYFNFKDFLEKIIVEDNL